VAEERTHEISAISLFFVGLFMGCVLTYATLSVKYHTDSTMHRREEEFVLKRLRLEVCLMENKMKDKDK